MDNREKYHFDLDGYLLVKGLLSKQEAARCLEAADAVAEKVRRTVDDEPHFTGHFGLRYHFDKELGVSSYQTNHGGEGVQYIVDDILNADPAFDVFVNHARSMDYVRELTEAPIQINSSELRVRHRGNITGTHMGGPIDPRNRYQFAGAPRPDSDDDRPGKRSFDLLNVRVLYALHDMPRENGPLCVVPGSHKANLHSPYGSDPINEPNMVVLPMEAGDALFFTENLRHGGFPNVMDQVRRTIHLCFAPEWVGSQSPAHWNGRVHVSEAAWARYDAGQRALLPPPGVGYDFIGATDEPTAETVQRLRRQVADANTANQNLNREISQLLRRNAELLEDAKEARRNNGVIAAVKRLFS